jgi:protocatechuate 3,4-dioxygenase beta subunit
VIAGEGAGGTDVPRETATRQRPTKTEDAGQFGTPKQLNAPPQGGRMIADFLLVGAAAFGLGSPGTAPPKSASGTNGVPSVRVSAATPQLLEAESYAGVVAEGRPRRQPISEALLKGFGPLLVEGQPFAGGTLDSGEFWLPPGGSLDVRVAGAQSLAPLPADRHAPDLIVAANTPAGAIFDHLTATTWMQGKPYRGAATIERQGGSVSVRVAGGDRDRLIYVFETANLVSTPVEVGAASCEPEPGLATTFLPKATVRGHVRWPEEAPAPREGLLQLSDATPGVSEAEAAVRWRYPIQFDQDGGWRATVPAGRWRLNLLSERLASGPLPSVALVAGEERRLGQIVLRTTASLLARVVSGADGMPLAGTLVEVFPAQAYPAMVEALLEGRTTRLADRACSGPRGWVRITGLPPGEYRARVSHGDDQPSFSGKFPLRAGVEAVIDPLEAQQPGTLLVRPQGLQDIDPDPSAFAVEARPYVDGQLHLTAALRAPVSTAWDALMEKVLPGMWRVTVLRVASGRPAVALWEQDVTVFPGDVTIVEPDLRGKIFHGSVQLDGQGVRGDLRVLGSAAAGGGGAEAGAQTDENGSFRIALRATGTFDVAFKGAGRQIDAVVPRVAFEDPEHDVIVRLPEGSIEGLVSDEKGVGVADADVQAARPPAAAGATDNGNRPLLSRTKSAADGSFRLSGMDSGGWVVSAEQGALRGGPVKVALAADQHLAGVNLVLHEGNVVSGRVLSSQGTPVSGAYVLVWAAEGAEGSLFESRDTTTGADGAFAIRLNASATGLANVEVHAQGWPVGAFRCAVGGDCELQLAPVGGSLVVRSERSAGQVLSGVLLINQNGAFVTAGGLFGAHTGVVVWGPPMSLSIPSLTPGTWKIVSIGGATEIPGVVKSGGASAPVAETVVIQSGQAATVTVK